MKVSIGMPVYNGERFVAAAIQSLLDQTYGDLEIVISDNGSSDRTEDICRSFAARDERIVYVRHETNRGAAWNHNFVVEPATGELFGWTGADDLHHPRHIERCVRALSEAPDAVLAYSRTAYIDEQGTIVREYDPGWKLDSASPRERMHEAILKGGHWVNADPLFGVIRLAAFRKTRMLPRYQGGDKRPLAELSLMGRFVEVPEHLMYRRRHDGASSVNNPRRTSYDTGSIAWMQRFFHGSAFQICMPSWNLFGDHLITAWRSQLGLADKLRLTASVASAARVYRSELAEEVAALVQYVFRKPLSVASLKA